MREEKVRDIRRELDTKLHNISLKSLLLVLIVLQFVVIGFLAAPDLNLQLPNSQTDSQTSDGPELTKYQRNYVDCPDKYLEVCTELSKGPTEEVTFHSVRDGKIYLEMGDGRMIVAELRNNGQDAEIITMK